MTAQSKRSRAGAPDVAELELEAKRRLAVHDQRLTPVRRALLEIFAATDRPLSVQDVVEAAKRRLPISSVYRNLSVLSDAGVLSRLNFDEGFVRYELDHGLTTHHHHLICSKCSLVIDVADDALADVESSITEAQRRIKRRYGFVVGSHQVELIGLCEGCA